MLIASPPSRSPPAATATARRPAAAPVPGQGGRQVRDGDDRRAAQARRDGRLQRAGLRAGARGPAPSPGESSSARSTTRRARGRRSRARRPRSAGPRSTSSAWRPPAPTSSSASTRSSRAATTTSSPGSRRRSPRASDTPTAPRRGTCSCSPPGVRSGVRIARARSSRRSRRGSPPPARTTPSSREDDHRAVRLRRHPLRPQPRRPALAVLRRPRLPRPAESTRRRASRPTSRPSSSRSWTPT